MNYEACNISQCAFYENITSPYSVNWIVALWHQMGTYRKFSNIRRTKSQNLNASRLILYLSLPNPLKPDVKLSMKM